ncbi:MAG: gfo/Idh/MocA family oxidoreductase [Thermoprotei archaeon]|nr:MAG: gfo/Idh/MocA family oxidoreductase [Thermoprotei archaeon]RLF20662.1 MAG: gfo/Idh/MocA family oxidoreductase [Thermoprotei archaeon]
MPRSKLVRAAVVGLGAIGPVHIKGYLQCEHAELVAVCDTRKELVKKWSKELKVDGYTSYIELLKREDIDAVSICTPHYLHAPMTIAAAVHGKHVLVEKPMATSLMEADEMIKACREAGVKLGVIFQSRFAEGPRKVKKAIEEGKLGKIVMAEAIVKWFRSDTKYYHADKWAESWRGKWSTEGGGALINQAIHTIDLFQWFLGPVDHLYGLYGTYTHTIEVEDAAVAVLKFKNGALGVIEGTVSMPKEYQVTRISILGSKGYVVLDGTEIKVWKVEGEEIAKEEKEEGVKETLKVAPDLHALQIKDFVESIIENREPLVNGEEGRKSLEIIIAIYMSERLRQPIKFPVKPLW